MELRRAAYGLDRAQDLSGGHLVAGLDRHRPKLAVESEIVAVLDQHAFVVSRLDDDVSFCRRLLEQEGVALTPGTAFCCPGYVRLAYTMDVSILMEAAERIKRFVQAAYSSSSGVSS